MAEAFSTSNVRVSTTASGITTLSIQRPHRRNAVNPATARELYAAILRFEEDPSQHVAILTGAEGTFCAGADLLDFTALQEQDPAAVDPQDRDHLRPVDGRNLGPMGPSRLQVQKPVIAAVAGHAVAGGLELSLLADIRVVEEDAVFGVFCRRWGVPLIDGGTVRLQAIVGLGRALDMILTGRPVSAQEALGMGLANRVVPRGQSLAEATKIAEQLLRFPSGCMKADRNSCYYAAYAASSFEDAMRNEFERGVQILHAESVPGAAQFAKGLGRHGKFDKL